MSNNEKTVFLIDYSGATSDSMFRDMAKYIARRFRPGDCVVGWHHQSFAVSFIGNPTYEDIIKVRQGAIGGTDLRQAILYARQMSPDGKLFVLSDGNHESLNKEFDYDLVIFTTVATNGTVDDWIVETHRPCTVYPSGTDGSSWRSTYFERLPYERAVPFAIAVSRHWLR